MIKYGWRKQNMRIGEKIAESRQKVRALEIELRLEEKRLKKLDERCTHQNTTAAELVIRVLDGEIRHPCIKCVDCGIAMIIPRSKKGK